MMRNDDEQLVFAKTVFIAAYILIVAFLQLFNHLFIFFSSLGSNHVENIDYTKHFIVYYIITTAVLLYFFSAKGKSITIKESQDKTEVLVSDDTWEGDYIFFISAHSVLVSSLIPFLSSLFVYRWGHFSFLPDYISIALSYMTYVVVLVMTIVYGFGKDLVTVLKNTDLSRP